MKQLNAWNGASCAIEKAQDYVNVPQVLRSVVLKTAKKTQKAFKCSTTCKLLTLELANHLKKKKTSFI